MREGERYSDLLSFHREQGKIFLVIFFTVKFISQNLTIKEPVQNYIIHHISEETS